MGHFVFDTPGRSTCSLPPENCFPITRAFDLSLQKRTPCVSAHFFVLRISTFMYSFAVSQFVWDVATISNQVVRPHLRPHPDLAPLAHVHAGVGVPIFLCRFAYGVALQLPHKASHEYVVWLDTS
jgi:hypothetical protein